MTWPQQSSSKVVQSAVVVDNVILRDLRCVPLSSTWVFCPLVSSPVHDRSEMTTTTTLLWPGDSYAIRNSI